MPSVTSSLRVGILVAAGLISACSQPSPAQKAQGGGNVAMGSSPVARSSAPPLDTTHPDVTTASSSVPAAGVAAPAAPPAELPPAGVAINQAVPPSALAVPASAVYAPAMVRLEVLLDRAGFSPGAIDGKDGENLRRALAAYAAAHGMTARGLPDKALWDALADGDAAPATQAYLITAADVAGPFIGTPSKDYQALSKLPALSYSSPEQLLAEKFHMSQPLLEALNPGADFSKAGATILVAAPRPAGRDYQAARIEVDKGANALRVYSADGELAAFYPASVGSAERPAPSGVFEVKAVAPKPAYYYDPKRLTFAPEGATGRLKIAPGPNNPVGSTWISLSVATYGIHGSPDPNLVGKRQSHGCVRLTNWDAAELGKAVQKGVRVEFIGREKKAGAKA